MPILYFAFANDVKHPLDELRKEEAGIRQLLEPFDARGELKIIIDSFATIDSVVQKLSLYKKDLVLFHFAGHAGPDHLGLEDRAAYSTGVAALLKECPILQAIILNGCATEAQVDLLLNICPLVIATSSAVSDTAATAFSLSLYRTLSYFATIEEAFSTARGHVLSIDQNLEINRSTGFTDQSTKEPVWGRYIKAGFEDVLTWRLPLRRTVVPEEYVPNQLLIDTLVQTLAPYNDNIAQIVQSEGNGHRVDLKTKKKAISNLFPKPISEPIRFLIVRPGPNETQLFFDQPGRDRLRLIITLFNTATELIAYITLSQLWDALNDSTQKVQLSDPSLRSIKHLLNTPKNDGVDFDFIALIDELLQLLEDNQQYLFVEEFKKLSACFKEGRQFYDACQYFQYVKQHISQLSEEEASFMSIRAEENLCVLLSELGFMSKYRITSVKNIDLLKYRHETAPNYRHRFVQIDDDPHTGLEEEEDLLNWYWDSSSVLLLRKATAGANTAFLNLSPFVIDKHTFDEKATLGNLHFFDHYGPLNNIYVYRPVTCNPNFSSLIIKEENAYQVLKTQFNAFSRLLFQQDLKELQ